MYENTEDNEAMHRLQTEDDRSASRTPPGGGQGFGQVAAVAVGLSLLPLALIVAASYPAVATLALALCVGGFVVGKQLVSGEREETPDRDSRPGEPDPDPTTSPSD